MSSTDGSNYSFDLSSTNSAVYSAQFNFADLDNVPGQITISYSATETGTRETQRLFLNPANQRFIAGPSLASVNSANRLSLTAADEIFWYMTDLDGNIA